MFMKFLSNRKYPCIPICISMENYQKCVPGFPHLFTEKFLAVTSLQPFQQTSTLVEYKKPPSLSSISATTTAGLEAFKTNAERQTQTTQKSTDDSQDHNNNDQNDPPFDDSWVIRFISSFIIVAPEIILHSPFPSNNRHSFIKIYV